MASQAQGKDCFIIPQANLDRFLPDGVTVRFLVSFTNEWKEEKTCLIFTLSRVKRDNFVRAVQTQRLTSESEIGCYTTILWI